MLGVFFYADFDEKSHIVIFLTDTLHKKGQNVSVYSIAYNVFRWKKIP